MIVTYNGHAWIEGCLHSLQSSCTAVLTIVVDNSSTDDTRERIRRSFQDVILIENRSNTGFGVGNNVGIAEAISRGAEYVMLLNQDALVLPDTVSRLTEFMDQHPEFGVATPLHCSPDPSKVDARTYVGYLRTSASDFLCDAARGSVLDHYKIRGVNAAIWLIRRSTLYKVGGFDPIFFMYGEDDDLINRFEEHGVAFALVPSVLAVHLRQSPPAPRAVHRLERLSRMSAKKAPTLIVMIKRRGLTQFMRLRMLIAHGFLVPFSRWIIEMNHEDFLASLMAFAQVMRKLTIIRTSVDRTREVGPHYIPFSSHD